MTSPSSYHPTPHTATGLTHTPTQGCTHTRMHTHGHFFAPPPPTHTQTHTLTPNPTQTHTLSHQTPITRYPWPPLAVSHLLACPLPFTTQLRDSLQVRVWAAGQVRVWAAGQVRSGQVRVWAAVRSGQGVRTLRKYVRPRAGT